MPNDSRLILTILLLSIALVGCQQSTNNAGVNTPPVEEPEATSPPAESTPEPTEETAAEVPVSDEVNLVWFDTDDGIFHILYPEGWATNQVPLETGIAFGIVPTAADLSAGPALFDNPAIMVYGSVEQIPPELAAKEQVANFHQVNYYGESSVFNYQIIGEPVITEPSPYIIYYFTQATAVLPTGVTTNWFLGTALADQTVVLFAVGVPDYAMEQYGDLFQQMFNSVEIDTEVTGQLVQ